MRIWMVEIGEPSPLDPSSRLFRYAQLSRFLAAQGHDVTWWNATFEHMKKRRIAAHNQTEMWHGVRIRFLDGMSYSKNVSLRRFGHHMAFARHLKQAIQTEDKPDVILAAIPTLEAPKIMIDYGLKHDIPVFLDIRDEWPDDLSKHGPAPVRFAMRCLSLPLRRMMHMMCQNV